MTLIHSIVVSEGVVTEPVTLLDAKAWANIDHTDDDALITTMIKGARQSLEKHLNLALVPKTVVMGYEVTGANPFVTLPYGATVSALTINELDIEDAETLLVASTDYFLRGDQLRMTAKGRYGLSYTVTPEVTQAIKEAIMMEVTERYNSRGDNGEGLSKPALEKALPFAQIWL